MDHTKLLSLFPLKTKLKNNSSTLLTIIALSLSINSFAVGNHDSTNHHWQPSSPTNEGRSWGNTNFNSRIGGNTPILNFLGGILGEGIGNSSPQNPPPHIMQNLDIQAVEARFSELDQTTLNGTAGSGMCAKGVRETLNELFPNKTMDNGPNAHKWTLDTVHRWSSDYCEAYDSSPNYQNFDIKVLQSVPGNSNPYGHIEIFYNGKWYSDFSQGASLANATQYSMSQTKIFRLSGNCPISRMQSFYKIFQHGSEILNTLSQQIFVAKAWASNIISEDSKIIPRKEKILGEYYRNNTRWVLISASHNQSSLIELYRIDASGKTSLMFRDNHSLFVALEKLNTFPEIPTKQISTNMMENWVKSVGENKAQAEILLTKEMTKIQKDLYVSSGFKVANQIKQIQIRKY